MQRQCKSDHSATQCLLRGEVIMGGPLGSLALAGLWKVGPRKSLVTTMAPET